MRESSTYQAILAEGREEGEHPGAVREARSILLLLGPEFLGEPSDAVRQAIRETDSLRSKALLTPVLIEAVHVEVVH